MYRTALTGHDCGCSGNCSALPTCPWGEERVGCGATVPGDCLDKASCVAQCNQNDQHFSWGCYSQNYADL